MPGTYYQVEGGRELRRTLRQAGSDLTELKEANAKAAKYAEESAVPLVPVQSGALLASLRSTGTKTAGIVRAGSARVVYAGPIHWGWGRRHIAAQPFASRGARMSEPRWLPIYKELIDRALAQITGA